MGYRDMFRKREVLVYLLTGFLESGKTSFLREVIREGQFADGKATLYILCEEGIEELDEKTLRDNRFTLRLVEDEEEITAELLNHFEEELRPDRVVIEYNGTWDPDRLLEAFPDSWMLVEGIATVDASTFEQYLNNMKQMMTRQYTYADLVVFNRSDAESMNLASFKRKARAVNRRSQVIFEMTDGSVDPNVREELPYDLEAPLIEVADEDFGIWYLDVFEHMDAYQGKQVRFKGIVYKPRRKNGNFFVPGRRCMTCCEADIQFYGFPCFYDDIAGLTDKDAVMVTAVIGAVNNEENGEPAPALKAVKVEKAEPPAEEIVFF